MGPGGAIRTRTLSRQTSPENAISVISDEVRAPAFEEREMAHEAGHWLGDTAAHEIDPNKLMSRAGGGGAKIPADDTLKLFNKNY